VRRLQCLVLFAISVPLFAQEQKPALSFLPGKKLFPRQTADGLAHQLSLSRVTENREWIGAIGASLPVVQMNFPDATVQASVAATTFNRLIKTPGHLAVYTIDYKVDFPFDLQFSNLTLRLAVGHMSCHFADDGIEILNRRSIQYVNDYVTVGWGYDLPLIGGNLYGIVSYIYHTVPIPNRPWLFQLGADVGNFPLTDFARLYGAFDVRVKQDVGWGSTQSYQVGVKLFTRGDLQLRFAYTLRVGFEDRGQFYLDKETKNMYGVFLDF
jgi:hypothetical protein